MTDKPRRIRLLPAKSKRSRRSRADMDHLKQSVLDLIAERPTWTVRQIHYRLVVLGLVENTSGEYVNTVVRKLIEWRRSGDISWDSVIDGTREALQPSLYDDPADFLGSLEYWAEDYRRSYWRDKADVFVQVWIEKTALAQIAYHETEPRGVTLYPAKGFSSGYFLRSAAKEIKSIRKPARIYLLGDYDKWGEGITANIEKELRWHCDDLGWDGEIHCQRLAITAEQAETLPQQPAKKGDDREYVVELDAMPPDELQSLIRECIKQHIDTDAWEELEAQAKDERERLLGAIKGLKRRFG
jgi:hypothetical protein